MRESFSSSKEDFDPLRPPSPLMKSRRLVGRTIKGRGARGFATFPNEGVREEAEREARRRNASSFLSLRLAFRSRSPSLPEHGEGKYRVKRSKCVALRKESTRGTSDLGERSASRGAFPSSLSRARSFVRSTSFGFLLVSSIRGGRGWNRRELRGKGKGVGRYHLDIHDDVHLVFSLSLDDHDEDEDDHSLRMRSSKGWRNTRDASFAWCRCWSD